MFTQPTFVELVCARGCCVGLMKTVPAGPELIEAERQTQIKSGQQT